MQALQVPRVAVRAGYCGHSIDNLDPEHILAPIYDDDALWARFSCLCHRTACVVAPKILAASLTPGEMAVIATWYFAHCSPVGWHVLARALGKVFHRSRHTIVVLNMVNTRAEMGRGCYLGGNGSVLFSKPVPPCCIQMIAYQFQTGEHRIMWSSHLAGKTSIGCCDMRGNYCHVESLAGGGVGSSHAATSSVSQHAAMAQATELEANGASDPVRKDAYFTACPAYDPYKRALFGRLLASGWMTCPFCLAHLYYKDADVSQNIASRAMAVLGPDASVQARIRAVRLEAHGAQHHSTQGASALRQKAKRYRLHQERWRTQPGYRSNGAEWGWNKHLPCIKSCPWTPGRRRRGIHEQEALDSHGH